MAPIAIVGTPVGFPAHFGSHIKNLWSNAQGDSVYVNPTAGNALLVVVFGLRSYDPFDLFHTNGVSPSGWSAGLFDFQAIPTVGDTTSEVIAVTSVSITSNVLTALGTNTLQAGQLVTLSGFTGGAAFLNGQTVTVATASGTQFTAPFTHANYGTTATITNIAITSNVLTVTATNTFAIGSQVKFSGVGTNTFLNGQTVTLLSANGTTFTANFTHANVVSGADTGSAVDADAGSAATSGGANNYVAISGNVQDGNADYTASLGNFALSSQWNLDGYYPTIRMFLATNVAAGPYKVTVKSVYQDGTTRPSQLAAGKPVFDGGVDIHVFELTNVLTASPVDASNGAMSAANPATAGALVPGTNGDVLISAGLMISANAFSTFTPVGQGTVSAGVMLASGKTVGGNAYWGVQMATQTTGQSVVTGFSNPLGYWMAVATAAIKHS